MGLAYMLLGGLLTDVGWRFAFLVYASAFLLLPLAIRHLQEPNLPRQPSPAIKNRKGLAAAVPLGLTALGYWVLGMSQVMSLVILGLLISGVGLGLNNPNLTTWIVALSPPEMRGRAVGARISFFFLGQFLSPILAQPIIGRMGILDVFTAAACLSLLILLCSLLLGRWMPETVE
jgi:MFS family permease